VAYLRVALSGTAAIFVALLVPFYLLMAPIGSASAIAIDLITAVLRASIVSPRLWLIAIVFFGLFFLASGLNSKVMRVVLFWIPTLAVSTFGFGISALWTYGWMLLRKIR
jgi:hypothetical protein